MGKRKFFTESDLSQVKKRRRTPTYRKDPINYLVGGNGIPRLRAMPMQYGAGLGGFFSGLFRKIIPFVSRIAKTGWSLAKPHLKEAAVDIGKGVFKRGKKAVIDIGTEAAERTFRKKQQTGGGVRSKIRRKQANKKNSIKRKAPFKKRQNSSRQSLGAVRHTVDDIFTN